MTVRFKRELAIRGEPYILTNEPQGLKLLHNGMHERFQLNQNIPGPPGELPLHRIT